MLAGMPIGPLVKLEFALKIEELPFPINVCQDRRQLALEHVAQIRLLLPLLAPRQLFAGELHLIAVVPLRVVLLCELDGLDRVRLDLVLPVYCDVNFELHPAASLVEAQQVVLPVEPLLLVDVLPVELQVSLRVEVL